jgi:hypothetical protein
VRSSSHVGTRWAEGPVWFRDGRYLLFSDIPNNRVLRWIEKTEEVSVFRGPSNYSDGNCRDRQGRLLTCEHDTRRLTRTEDDGTITVLMDRQEHESSPDGKARTPWSITKGGGQGKTVLSSQRRSVSLDFPFYRTAVTGQIKS